jgi:Uma2 family endonuclease
VISVEEYVYWAYSPEYEYVDGALIATNVGEIVHASDDHMSRMLEKLQEYAAFGTPNIWVLDPAFREMYVFERHCLREIKGDIVATESPRLELTRDEIFRD